jgi:hypothetical protein
MEQAERRLPSLTRRATLQTHQQVIGMNNQG